ncbi:trimethylguanosine synthase-like [Babesia ovis]|uniref:Trimethylguanosine synthase n=1 Tax=Babesia ovis TaxID=5869 RepID=A0A9W5TCG8_BABOV|nr:trimethylguanosine synthase-like [Babesia ovis]
MVEEARTRQGRVDIVPPPRGVFDIRADRLTPEVLYLASGAGENGKIHTAFIHVIEKHLLYDPSGENQNLVINAEDELHETYLKAIFRNQSPELKLDETAYVDASWAAESTEVARELKTLANTQPNFTKTFDKDVADVNRMQHSTGKTRVLELAAGVGGNLVYFGLENDLAVGVEMNPERVEICKNNVQVFGLNNTHVVQNDLFEYVQRFAEDPLKQAAEIGVEDYFRESPFFDYIHISPPWGGKRYAGSANDAIYKLQHSFDIEAAMHNMAKIGNIVSIFLPRSQSVNELVRLANIGNFPLIIIAAYHIPKKVRCIHAHFVKNVNCFNYLKVIKMARTHVPYKQAPHSLNQLIHSTPYTSNHVDISSEMHMDYVVHALMKLIEETMPAVAIKMYYLLRNCPLVDVLALANQAKEIQLAGGMKKLNSEEKRTTGGIFFHLLKTQNKQLYKQIESLAANS